MLGTSDFKFSVLIFWVEYVENAAQEHLIEVVAGHGGLLMSLFPYLRALQLLPVLASEPSAPFFPELYSVHFPFSGWRQWF